MDGAREGEALKRKVVQEGHTILDICHIQQKRQISGRLHQTSYLSHAPKFTNIRKVTPYWIFVTCTQNGKYQEGHTKTYLIFVISFTQAKILENKIIFFWKMK